MLFVNFGRLELTYRLPTFRDYSYSNKVPCEKRSNFIINTGTSVRPFQTWQFWHFQFKHNFAVSGPISIKKNSLTGNIMGTPNPILFLDRFDYFFFFFDLEIPWGSQIRYCTLPKWLTGPQKFVIIIRCKINFDILRISAANLTAIVYIFVYVVSKNENDFEGKYDIGFRIPIKFSSERKNYWNWSRNNEMILMPKSSCLKWTYGRSSINHRVA